MIWKTRWIDRPAHARNAAIFDDNIIQKETYDDTTLRNCAYALDPVGTCWRMVINPAHERKGGEVKHASDIFPHALAELLAMGDKARQQRETRARDTRLRGNDKTGGRESARVSRKEKREQLKIQFN